MNTYTPTRSSGGISGWFARTEAWLDAKGKPAWIATLVVSLVVFWPIGLLLLAYIIWSNKLTCSSSHRLRHHGTQTMRGSSGNSAFDAYRNETLRRLEEEQQSFEAFLERLRAARDKAEFDQFMEERAHNADPSDDDDTPEDDRNTPRAS